MVTRIADDAVALPEAYVELHRRGIALRAQVAELTDQLNQVKRQLRSDLGDGHFLSPDGLVLAITPVQRFDGAKAAKFLPPELYEMCCTSVPTSALARKVLSPDIYAACSSPSGEGRVELG